MWPVCRHSPSDPSRDFWTFSLTTTASVPSLWVFPPLFRCSGIPVGKILLLWMVESAKASESQTDSRTRMKSPCGPKSAPSCLFVSLLFIQKLTVNDNQIDEVKEAALRDYIHLRVLDLSQNRLHEQVIAPHTWNHLKYVHSPSIHPSVLKKVLQFLCQPPEGTLMFFSGMVLALNPCNI